MESFWIMADVFTYICKIGGVHNKVMESKKDFVEYALFGDGRVELENFG